MPCCFRHRVPDAETVAAPVNEMRIGSRPRWIMKAARTAHRRRAIAALLAHEALQLGNRHRAVVARLDLGIGVELEASQSSFAFTAPFDRGEPCRCRDFIEQVAGQRISCFRQHRQGCSRCCRRRNAAGELVRVDNLACLVARMRPVDRELPRPQRAEALNLMLWYREVVWIVAAIPAP